MSWNVNWQTRGRNAVLDITSYQACVLSKATRYICQGAKRWHGGKGQLKLGFVIPSVCGVFDNLFCENNITVAVPHSLCLEYSTF